MRRFKLFEEFTSYEGGGGKWPGYTKKEKKGKFVVTIVTKEALDRYRNRYPGSPVSARHMGYHLSPVPYDEAVKKQKELQEKGTYKGETIQSVVLFKKSEIEQGD